MTDRVRTLVVILEKDFRDDDASTIAEAISMVKGVNHVRLGEVVGIVEHMARDTAKMELRKELYTLLKPSWEKS